MMAFVDVCDEAAATDGGSFLSNSALYMFTKWVVFALVLNAVLRCTVIAFCCLVGGFVDVPDLDPARSCWWQVLIGGKKQTSASQSSCRQSRYFQCQKRKRRRRKEQGERWECPLAKLHQKICNMPPPLPFHRRRRAPCFKSEKALGGPASIAEDEIQPESEESPSSCDERDRVKSPQAQQPIASPSVAVQTIDLARMQQWSRLIDRVICNPREARLVDIDGLMPLHWACSGGPPLQAIQSLLKAYPRACKKTDSDGSTALHFASHYSASAPVVQALVDAYTKAVRMKDKHGRTPLYHAVSKSSSVEIIRILIKADPSMTLEPCLPSTQIGQVNGSRPPNHRTPLYIAWSAVTSSSQTRRRRRGKLWEKAQLLLEAAFKQHASRKDRTTYRMQHAVIKLDSYLPSHAIRIAVSHVPNHLLERDERNGRLPLALAAASNSPRALEMIQLLLSACPRAARVADANGQTALSVALSSGKQWDEGVKVLFEAAPDVLSRRDHKSRLYPALVAAAASVDMKKASSREQGESASQSELEDKKKQNTLYNKPADNHFSSNDDDKTIEWRSQAVSNVITNEDGMLLPTKPPLLATKRASEIDARAHHTTTIYKLFRADPSILPPSNCS